MDDRSRADEQPTTDDDRPRGPLSRRRLLERSLVAGAALSLPAIAAACRGLRRQRLELGGLHAAREQRGARDDGSRGVERGARHVGGRVHERLGARAHGIDGRGRDDSGRR